MSLYDYKKAIELRNDESVSFYSLIMAAILRADTHNLSKLRHVFTNTYNEVYDRYWAPGGALPVDREEKVIVKQLTDEEKQRLIDEWLGDNDGI